MAESALERATSLGLNSVGVADLAAIGFSRRPEDVALAEFAVRELLQRLDSIRRLGELSPAELREHFGLEDFEVDRALALLELGRRTAAMAPGDSQIRRHGYKFRDAVEQAVVERRGTGRR